MRYYIPENGELKLRQRDMPKPHEDEVLIEVKAIGLNRADILKIDGLYGKDDPSNVPGLEIAGFIAGTNQKVMALITHGGFASQVIARKAHIIELEADADLTRMAAVPEALTTCYMNLIDKAGAKNNNTVLIHGGSSGIGSIGIQMMKSLGCRVLTTVGNMSKLEGVKALGADEAMLYTDSYDQKWRSSVNIVLDILGGEYLQKNINTMTYGGKICVIALMQGAKAEINVGQLLMKNLSIFGSTLKSQSDEAKARLIKGAYNMFKNGLANGKIRPVIDSIFDFSQMSHAIEKMRSRNHFGKIIVKL